MCDSTEFTIYIRDLSVIPAGTKAILFDRFESILPLMYEFDSNTRVRRIHPKSICWAKQFDHIIFVGPGYEEWRGYLDVCHYVLENSSHL